VVDPAGQPVPNLQLSVFPFGPNPAACRTDANGRYAFPWGAHRSGSQENAFCLVARDAARNLAAARDIEEGMTNLDLRLEPALVLSGVIQDSNGAALSNATVQVSLWTGAAETQFGGRLKPDGAGRFTVNGLPTGRHYTIRAFGRNLGLASQELEAESTLTNRIELPRFVFKLPDRKLAGRVVDEDEKPVPGLQVTLQGEDQFYATARTDENGRFVFDPVRDGPIRLLASRQKAYARARAQAGDTNVLLRLGTTPAPTAREATRRASLEGHPLPDLAAAGVPHSAVPDGAPVLLCLFDIEQRPARRFARLLGEQYDALRQKGLTVVGLQATPITPESYKEWRDTNPVPYPVGRVAVKSDDLRWASDVESLPWLILSDKAHKVVAEGFTLEDLDAKLQALKP